MPNIQDLRANKGSHCRFLLENNQNELTVLSSEMIIFFQPGLVLLSTFYRQEGSNMVLVILRVKVTVSDEFCIVTWLVVSTPLKNMKVSWDDDIPNIWKVIIQPCSKPPTSHSYMCSISECEWLPPSVICGGSKKWAPPRDNHCCRPIVCLCVVSDSSVLVAT